MAKDIGALTHEHVFLGERHERNERRVWLVIAITATMMVIEIAAGSIYGSMALIADGWHMSTHAAALMITALAYLYARRHARDPRFTFGTGKLGDLAGFGSAVVLALVALLIGWESFGRLLSPVQISFDQAIAVAVIGLIVNIVCAWLLKDDHTHHHGHGHGHGSHGHGSHGHGAHGHAHAAHADHAHAEHGHDHPHPHPHDHDHPHPHGDEGHAHGAHSDAPAAKTGARDNNLRGAYLHVMADALTSVLAIAALLLGRMNGWIWADAAMGIVGALVIARWSWGLIRDAGAVLLDVVPEESDLTGEIRKELEVAGDRITDLHVWQVGPGHYAAIVSLFSARPRLPAEYKAKLAHIRELSHLTVEVQEARAAA
ncbi:CDF family Co(II)/Ni(II) efflux transporter DmeF [Afifella sp. IM 167]|uniref:CDF family Co(II)/Ni(II) efflux transporter DmeF n=1 Tax=Afifella sp. IM 167 TaxID=2033586 RepID=UPI001CCAB362|nr:CDF family Co(II)/Ni(II) efflux transporter DmeF [Afifella sp. IM 167]